MLALIKSMKYNDLLIWCASILFLLFANSCGNHKIIGEHISFHYVHYSNFPISDKKLKEKITNELYISNKLDIIVRIHSTDWSKNKYTYYGNGKNVNNTLIVTFFKKEEREFSSGFCDFCDFKTIFYKEPFIVNYVVSTNTDGARCIRYFDFLNNDKYNEIDEGYWNNEYIFYTPKQIRKRDN